MRSPCASCATPTPRSPRALDAARVENGAAEEALAGGRRRPRPRHLAPADAQGRLRGRADACRGGRPPTTGSTRWSPSCGAPSSQGRGERWLEGTFALHARHRGNGVGYDSICAAGDHANTLHWIKNTGEVREGDLVLIDAGVEVDSLYTADITRTLPVSGTFTDAQREIYDAVFAAQEAGIAAVKPGNTFSDVHAAAIRVIAEHLHAWGLLPDGRLGRGHPRQGARPVPPTLDGARHLAPPRPRRARLRPRHPRGVHGCRARAGHGAHRRARALLQGRRPARARAVPRHRGAHRGRRRRHRRRLREPLGRDAAHRRPTSRPGSPGSRVPDPRAGRQRRVSRAG